MSDKPKLKAWSDDNLHVDQVVLFVLERLKTLWEKKKMLVTFSHNVFKGDFSQRRQKFSLS